MLQPAKNLGSTVATITHKVGIITFNDRVCIQSHHHNLETALLFV